MTIRYLVKALARFWQRKKEDATPEVKVNWLKDICTENGRPDLYEPLSRIISLHPQSFTTTEQLLRHTNAANYIVAANTLIYNNRIEEAKLYFEKAAQLEMGRDISLNVVPDNFDLVVKIAQEFWRKTVK